MWRRLKRAGLAAIGDDGSGPFWGRLTPHGLQVVRLAGLESRDLGHPCLAGEHLLLAVLRDGQSRTAALLRAEGIDLETARADLQRLGPTLGPRSHPALALRSLGIEVDAVRERLSESFGPEALAAAERRVRRRPRWRGGHARPDPLCVYLLAKRGFQFAVEFADARGDVGVGPDHLAYGVLRDALDPLGTQMSRRGKRQLDALGWCPGRVNPVRSLVEARRLDLSALTARIG